MARVTAFMVIILAFNLGGETKKDVDWVNYNEISITDSFKRGQACLFGFHGFVVPVLQGE